MKVLASIVIKCQGQLGGHGWVMDRWGRQRLQTWCLGQAAREGRTSAKPRELRVPQLGRDTRSLTTAEPPRRS